jgi:esterase/lipase superfamily enzyme
MRAGAGLRWIRPNAALAALALTVLSGCAGRGVLLLDPQAAAVGTTETVLVGTARTPLPGFPYFGDGRSFVTGYGRYVISVPPDRKPGRVRFPVDGRADPAHDFLVVSAERLDNRASFVAALDRALAADPRQSGEAALFLHGYNTNFAEGLVRQAQILHDLDRSGAAVQFAWPSKAKATGYLYDRESVIFARDALRDTLGAIADSRARSINVFAHSMGALLAVDTLSVMADGNDRVFDRLKALVLVEADVEIDVFRRLAPAILARGVKIYLLVSDKDRALEISSRLRGEPDRLGSVRNTAELGGLDVPVIDLTDVRSTDLLGHLKEGENPALIDYIDSLGSSGLSALEGSGSDALLQGGLSLIQQGANIVVAPLQLR